MIVKAAYNIEHRVHNTMDNLFMKCCCRRCISINNFEHCHYLVDVFLVSGAINVPLPDNPEKTLKILFSMIFPAGSFPRSICFCLIRILWDFPTFNRSRIRKNDGRGFQTLADQIALHNHFAFCYIANTVISGSVGFCKVEISEIPEYRYSLPEDEDL